MFFWVEGPPSLDALSLLPKAVEHGVAFVPGAAFYASQPRRNTLRLSFVTVSPDQIDRGIALLAQAMQSENAHDPPA
jgi:2-aminoadipate transaminase